MNSTGYFVKQPVQNCLGGFQVKDLVESSAIESALIQNDLSRLTPEQRLSYYKAVCDSVGLNPLTQPFAFITLNGKLTLYALRAATDQLRRVHGVSITITSREKFDDVYVVTAQARDKNGRVDESTGAVSVGGLKGDALANAFLKAETKSKRRVTLSICGLGLLDESETETIPGATPYQERLDTRVKEPERSVIESPPHKVSIPTQAGAARSARALTVSFGKYAGAMVGELIDIHGIHQIGQYRDWLMQSAKQKGKELQGQVLDFVDAVTEVEIEMKGLGSPPPFDFEEEMP